MTKAKMLQRIGLYEVVTIGILIGFLSLLTACNGRPVPSWEEDLYILPSDKQAVFYGVGSIWGTSLKNIYASMAEKIYQFNGVNWVDQGIEGEKNKSQLSLPIWGSGSSDVWYGFDWHYNGKTWIKKKEKNGYIAQSIIGSLYSNVYAISYRGKSLNTFGDRLLMHDGKEWKTIELAPKRFSCIWVSNKQNIYLGAYVGPNVAGVYKYTKKSGFNRIDTNIKGYVSGIWGISDDRVYAIVNNYSFVGSSYEVTGTLLHYNGKTWKKEFSVDSELKAIHGDESAKVVFVVGIRLIMIRKKGKWKKIFPSFLEKKYGDVCCLKVFFQDHKAFIGGENFIVAVDSHRY